MKVRVVSLCVLYADKYGKLFLFSLAIYWTILPSSGQVWELVLAS